MKAYRDLTRLGRIRRKRVLGAHVLRAYGLEDVRLALVREAGNTLFRVDASDPVDGCSDTELFEPGRFLLRIHQPGYQATEAIQLELEWLTAMRSEADLPVPEPVRSLDGALLMEAQSAGLPERYHCSLLRWVKARHLAGLPLPRHLREQGRLMARLHDFAATWGRPAGLAKRRLDWDGLFSDDAGSGMPHREAWHFVPAEYREAFATVAARVSEAMGNLGSGPDAFGLIHADLATDANLLFWHGQPRAIDFDDSAFGYWAYDLGVALEHVWSDARFTTYRDALLDGYASLRALPQSQQDVIELFSVATKVYWNLWAIGIVQLHPEHRQNLQERMKVTSEQVVRYAASR